MIIETPQPLDLESTLLSGQAFRWQRSDGWYRGVVFGNVVKLRKRGDGLEILSTPDDEQSIEPIIRDYFGFKTDLQEIYNSFSCDTRIQGAITRYRGMRILQQDPWECLVSFICSSNSNIGRITRNIHDICVTFGRPISSGADTIHAFPTPRDLADAGEDLMGRLRLGYRTRYISDTARVIADGRLDLISLREESYTDALEALIGLPGVGDKVANCVLLFSLNKPEAFPVDVWIHRALREWYLSDEEKNLSRPKIRLWAQKRFGRFAGYANQYLFHDRRLEDRSNQHHSNVG